jgi:phage-related holin
MVVIKKNSLQINIIDTEPQTRKQWIIKSLAAAIRWSAYADKVHDDKENIIVIAELIDELLEEERRELL